MNQRQLYGVLVLVIIIAGATIVGIMLLQGIDAGPSVTMVADDETETSISLTQMQGMEKVEGVSSFENRFNNTRGQGTYTGVPISALVNAAGGMTETQIIEVEASDGYKVKFVYWNVFPNASIKAIQGEMILAYSYNDTVVPAYEDGFRLAFIPEDGFHSNTDMNETTDPEYRADSAGALWISNVVKITIKTRPGIALTVNIAGTSKGYTTDDLMDMESITGEGGYKKSTGTIEGPHTYTGVRVLDLLQDTGTLPANFSLEAISSDAYRTVYTMNQTYGEFDAYDSTTGDSIGLIDFNFTLIYYEDGEPIPSGGPFRLGTLNDNGDLTDGHLWAKDVIELNIIDLVEPWKLELCGVEEWNMTHHEFYSLASCAHHRTTITVDDNIYAGVPLHTIVAAMDGADDEHYVFNTTIVFSNYSIVVFNTNGENQTFYISHITQNPDVIIAGWIDDVLVSDDDGPIILVTANGIVFPNVVQVAMFDWA
ncbi:MAG: hypothetical protein GF411_00055 [Candidatus Lokiarchaeota archaeon]|nr:hypothetical protein [Candidatus Lokiarchaeota archaeon]